MAEPERQNMSAERWDVRATLTTRREVETIEGAGSAPGGASAVPVETLPLVVRPGLDMRFEDRYFTLKREGLYRFVNWGRVRYAHPLGRPEITDPRRNSRALIVHEKDVFTLLASLAALTAHGHTHDNASHEERLARMKLGGAALTCGSIAAFTCRLLTDMGRKARLVHCLRTEGVYDTYDCGHILCEFYCPERRNWVLADVDTHMMFVSGGEYLDMAGVKALLDDRKPFELEPLTLPGLGVTDTTEEVTTGFTGMALFHHLLLDPEKLMEWYCRMFAAVSLDGDCMVYHCSDPRGQERVKLYHPGVHFLDRAAWLERYYKGS